MLRHLKSVCNAEWQPVSRWALYAWAAFYALFVAYAASQHGEGLLIDNVNLVVHEGGHALFGWFGSFIGLCGGTALQLLVPLMLASYFFVQRQAPGLAFCIFFFFENLLGVATYMADARSMSLPLITIGDPEFAIHDWNAILGTLGILNYDTTIASVIRLVGWTGMALTPVCLVIWSFRKSFAQSAHDSDTVNRMSAAGIRNLSGRWPDSRKGH